LAILYIPLLIYESIALAPFSKPVIILPVALFYLTAFDAYLPIPLFKELKAK
jgi:hypothetical protein